MNEKTKSEMDEILDNYSKSQKQAEQKQSVAESKEKTFLEVFKNKITDTIRLCLEEFSVVLDEQGHEGRVAVIDLEEDNLDISKPKILMKVFPNGIDFSNIGGYIHDIPQIAFYAIFYEQKVVTYINITMFGRGGTSGPEDKFFFDEITPETIREEVLKFLKKVFQNALFF